MKDCPNKLKDCEQKIDNVVAFPRRQPKTLDGFGRARIINQVAQVPEHSQSFEIKVKEQPEPPKAA